MSIDTTDGLIPELPTLDVPDSDRGPTREWLVHCFDSTRYVANCSVEVNAGTITIAAPQDEAVFFLDRAHIAAFQDALRAAITQANADYLNGHYVCCG
ncbi:MAG: hypothetical protein ACRDRL_10070 [Sciscionella sp.]